MPRKFWQMWSNKFREWRERRAIQSSNLVDSSVDSIQLIEIHAVINSLEDSCKQTIVLVPLVDTESHKFLSGRDDWQICHRSEVSSWFEHEFCKICSHLDWWLTWPGKKDHSLKISSGFENKTNDYSITNFLYLCISEAYCFLPFSTTSLV